MADQNINNLFLQLRSEAPSAPRHLSGEVLARLGPSVKNLRLLSIAGAVSCFTAVLVSAGISFGTVQHNHSATPPALALFSVGFGPVSTP